MLFLLAALRAIVEMLGLCLLAQGVLYLVCGPRRADNPMYRLFALLTHPPRRLAAMLLPAGAPEWAIALFCFVTLFVLWIGLALAKLFFDPSG